MGGALTARPACLLPVLLHNHHPLHLQVSSPHEGEFLSYYLILSCSTFGSFRASTANVVRLLNQMGRDVLVRRAGGWAAGRAGARWRRSARSL